MKKLFALCALALLLVACDKLVTKPVTFNSVDITGADYAQGFALTDHTGKARTLADFKGKTVMLFFGFTQCPDICPSTMTRMNEVMTKLGPKAEQVQVLFVTLDPERDTQELLSQYVPAFNPKFLGLYGDLPTTTRVAKDFKTFFAKSAGATPESYSIDHQAGTYVFDAKGKIRLFIRDSLTADQVAQDVQLLLN